jgi:hypothetical protein
MDEVFVIAFTGGYEAPSYEVKATVEEALSVAETWAEDLEDGDTIDVLRINVKNFTLSRVHV